MPQGKSSLSTTEHPPCLFQYESSYVDPQIPSSGIFPSFTNQTPYLSSIYAAKMRQILHRIPNPGYEFLDIANQKSNPMVIYRLLHIEPVD